MNPNRSMQSITNMDKVDKMIVPDPAKVQDTKLRLLAQAYGTLGKKAKRSKAKPENKVRSHSQKYLTVLDQEASDCESN